MRHLLRSRRRPSAAMIVAIVALVVAASGTAVAAGRLVSGDSLIKKNSLSGNRLRNRSLSGAKIKVSSLGKVPSASKADLATNATNATNAMNATTASAAPIAKVTYVENTVPVDTTSGSGTGVVATASCPVGTVVTGGGASVVDNTGGFVNASYPTGKTGWAAVFFDNTMATTGTVTAICAPAAATAP